MAKHLHSWEQPKDVFLGVPYLYAGENHPYRYETSWAFTAGLPRHEAVEHPLLPKGFRLARLQYKKGNYLIDERDRPVGIHVEKDEGFLINLDSSDEANVRGRIEKSEALGRKDRLGSLFLAASIDAIENDPAWPGRKIGTYSPAGLKATMRAHEILVEYAERCLGKTISDRVRDKVGWQPQNVPSVPVSGTILDYLQSMHPGVQNDEASVVLAFLAGPDEGKLVAITDDPGNTLAYVFETPTGL